MSWPRLQAGWRARRVAAAHISVIVAFFLCFFAWVLFRGRVLVGGDAFLYSYPLRTAAWNAIRSGSLPLWTPTLFAGYPLLSMAQLGLGYPLTWGYALLPGWYAEEIYVLAPFLLAPVFTYAFARNVGRSPSAALLAGLTFGYGGLLVSPLATTAMHSNTVTWLPLVLLAVERSRRARFNYCLVGASAAYALSVLAGHAHTFLYVGLIANVYGLFLSLFTSDQTDDAVARRNSRWHGWRPLAVSIGATLLGAGVAAFQLFETMRAVRRSARTKLDYEYYLHSAYTLRTALASLVAPLYTDKTVDVTPYVPPLALALAVFSVAAACRRSRREPRIFLWAVLALTGWLLMLGGTTPLARLLYYIPVLNLFRFPARHTFEWTFAIAMLAAYGWDAAARALSKKRPHARALPLGLICLALGAVVGWAWWRATGAPPGPGWPAWYVGRLSVSSYLLWKSCFVTLTVGALWLCWRATPSRRRTGALTCTVALLCFVEPCIAGWQWWHMFAKSPARYTTPAATTRFLLAQAPARGRVYTRVHLDVEEFEPQPQIDGPDLPTLYGLENVGGYEPLILERYSRALRNVWLDDDIYRRAGAAPDLNLLSPRSHVLDLLNTNYLISYAHLAETPQDARGKAGVGDELEAARWRVEYDKEGALVLRNLRALPRVWLVAEAEAVDGEEALQRIRGEGAREFDPRRTALLEVRPDELPPLPGGPLAPESDARIVSYEPNRLVVETSAPTATVLVMSEIFYPGWTATVDGRPERIKLTDYLLRGIALPPGRHRIELRYTATAARNGAFISALTLALLAGLLGYTRVAGRKH
jgi:hypothetical protein